MKRFIYMFLVGLLAVGSIVAQQEIYKRTLINLPAAEPSSFGNFVAGVDLDGDGKLEVYAVNNDWNDVGQELIPTLYKFEQNASGGWDSVWSWQSSIPLQNTWPSLTVGDLDGDGKQELIWCPINNIATGNLNPARILVFESVASQEALGVNNGPNSTYQMTALDSKNIRPFKIMAHDFDHDGKDELVFCDRASSIYRFGVVGVTNVPDDGDNTGVVWSYKYEGLAANTAINAGTYYDFTIVDSTIFFFSTNGNVQPLMYANGTYTLAAKDSGLIPGGSWKSSATVDLDGAGSKEVIVSSWTTTAADKKVRVLQKTNDSTLVLAAAIDMSPYLSASGQLYSGAAGDVDGDGKPEYVVGSRDDNSKAFRVEYQGGGVNNASNYTVTEIDRGVVSTSTRMDVALANVDGNAGDEVFYTSSTDGRVPIVVLSDAKPAHKVTFNVNTSGIPDTLKINSVVQVRGGTTPLTWDNTSVKTANKGGDYWSATALFTEGDTVAYKYFTNVKSAITGSDNGWEANVSNWGNGNRRFVLGTSDTTLPLEYANGFMNNALQTDAPFPTGKADTVVMFLRVNMQAAIQAGVFDPAKHKVAVRGSFTAADWGTSQFLSPQGSHANGGQTTYDGNNIYTIPIYFNKTAITSTPFHVLYKFVIHNINGSATEDWSTLASNVEANRGDFDMPLKDTTIAWVWYNNAAYIPPLGKDTVNVKFHTDLTTAIANKGFEAGDTIVVHYGYNNSASATLIDTLRKVGLSGNVYESPTIKVTGVAVGVPLQYQYYHVKFGTEVRENYFDFTDKAGSSSTEKRKAPVSANNATFTQFDTSKSGSDPHRIPNFPSSKKLTQNVLVTFTCDLRPAYYQLAVGDSIFDTQGAFRTLVPTDKDSVYGWGVWINGPAVGGWSNTSGDWGAGLRANAAKKMFDDGTHGDAVAGDHIYTMQVQFYKDSANNTVGQVFKFGLNGGDNEGGSASGYGNNHSANIDDATSAATIATDFGSINPLYYDNWNFDTHSALLGVKHLDENVPLVFSLEQNYPNPFNPSTTIQYSIPSNSRVILKVYNMLGQEVMTLVNETLAAGKYNATFNASRLASGVYIYRIEAGSFTSVKKMMLLK